MPENYLFSKTSFQSPSFIKNDNYRLPVNEKYFNTPGNSMQLQYVNGKNGNWKASIFREDLRGHDHFKDIQSFNFKIYSTAFTSQHEFPSFNLIFKDSSLSDTITFATDFVNKWADIHIPVSSLYRGFKIPKDVIGVQFSQNGDDGKKHTIYIDDIEFFTG